MVRCSPFPLADLARFPSSAAGKAASEHDSTAGSRRRSWFGRPEAVRLRRQHPSSPLPGGGGGRGRARLGERGWRPRRDHARTNLPESQFSRRSVGRVVRPRHVPATPLPPRRRGARFSTGRARPTTRPTSCSSPSTRRRPPLRPPAALGRGDGHHHGGLCAMKAPARCGSTRCSLKSPPSKTPTRTRHLGLRRREAYRDVGEPRRRRCRAPRGGEVPRDLAGVGLMFSDEPAFIASDHETERARYWLPCVDHPPSEPPRLSTSAPPPRGPSSATGHPATATTTATASPPPTGTSPSAAPPTSSASRWATCARRRRHPRRRRGVGPDRVLHAAGGAPSPAPSAPRAR